MAVSIILYFNVRNRWTSPGIGKVHGTAFPMDKVHGTLVFDTAHYYTLEAITNYKIIIAHFKVLLPIFTIPLLPIITVIMNSLLPIISRSITGNNEFLQLRKSFLTN